MNEVLQINVMLITTINLILVVSVIVYLLVSKVIHPHIHYHENRCHCGDHGESLGFDGHHFGNCPEYGDIKD